MGWLTNAASFLFPERTKKFLEVREQREFLSAMRSGFDAADALSRLRAKTPTQSLGPVAEIVSSRQTLVNTARLLDRNNSWVHGVWNAVANNVVGTGIVPEPRIRKQRPRAEDRRGQGGVVFDSARNDILSEAWDRWSRGVDKNRRMSFSELQWLVERELNNVGEILVVFTLMMTPIPADPNTPRDVPLALELVDSERLAALDQSLPDGEIIQGVEFDSLGVIRAYHIYPEHPADGRAGSLEPVRIPAYRVLHLFHPHRPQALRGLPRIHSVAKTFEALAQYLDFELTRARIASAFAVMIKRGGMPLRLPSTGDVSDTRDANQNPVGLVEGGMILTGGPNDSIESASPSNLSPAFEPFVKLMVRSAAVGINVSYGFLARDHSDSNFSAARQEYLEDLKHWRPRQRFLVQHLCEPVYRAWFTWAGLTGQIPGMEALSLEDVHLRWRTPGWDWVDPKVEVEADILAIQAGLKSPQEASMERGRDYYETVDQLSEARQYAEEAGLKTLTIFPPEIPTDGASPEDDSADGKKKQPSQGSQPARGKPFAAA